MAGKDISQVAKALEKNLEGAAAEDDDDELDVELHEDELDDEPYGDERHDGDGDECDGDDDGQADGRTLSDWQIPTHDEAAASLAELALRGDAHRGCPGPRL